MATDDRPTGAELHDGGWQDIPPSGNVEVEVKANTRYEVEWDWPPTRPTRIREIGPASDPTDTGGGE